VARKTKKHLVYTPPRESLNPLDGLVLEDRPVESPINTDETPMGKPIRVHPCASVVSPLSPAYRDDAHGIWLYHGNCLALLDAIAAKHPEGCFDMIFADPPYFLSNGGITCHAGRMVKVDKGDWDKSRGAEENHNFNTEWLRRCQKVLKPNGTLWVTGTHHVIFSVGYAMQQLGFKILNDIAWEKPNPPPNLSCRYFTHSTETVLWAAKSEKSKHLFNYQAMKAVTGKQMKTVWQIYPPRREEKENGKHPTQKPVALIERCLLASTNEGNLVLDPFMGNGTTAVACVHTGRSCVGIELEEKWIEIAKKRVTHQVVARSDVSAGGGVTYADYAFQGFRDPPATHWRRPSPTRETIWNARIRQRKEEQRLGRPCAGALYQPRSKLSASPEWIGVGIKDNIVAIEGRLLASQGDTCDHNDKSKTRRGLAFRAKPPLAQIGTNHCLWA
jgi:site-specific DNA-methyltransferase (adenine-specific)